MLRQLPGTSPVGECSAAFLTFTGSVGRALINRLIVCIECLLGSLAFLCKSEYTICRSHENEDFL